jgi:hypothetical protein
MEPSSKPLDLLTETALRSLKDIDVPSPVSMRPETWGWYALILMVVLLFALLVAWRFRRYRAQRYRREALAELAKIAPKFDDPLTSESAVDELNALLKRTALARWQRADVAALSGAAWIKFLNDHAGETGIDGPLARMLDDIEYQSDWHIRRLPFNTGKTLVEAARKWIGTHHVSA